MTKREVLREEIKYLKDYLEGNKWRYIYLH